MSEQPSPSRVTFDEIAELAWARSTDRWLAREFPSVPAADRGDVIQEALLAISSALPRHPDATQEAGQWLHRNLHWAALAYLRKGGGGRAPADRRLGPTSLCAVTRDDADALERARRELDQPTRVAVVVPLGFVADDGDEVQGEIPCASGAMLFAEGEFALGWSDAFEPLDRWHATTLAAPLVRGIGVREAKWNRVFRVARRIVQAGVDDPDVRTSFTADPKVLVRRVMADVEPKRWGNLIRADGSPAARHEVGMFVWQELHRHVGRPAIRIVAAAVLGHPDCDVLPR